MTARSSSFAFQLIYPPCLSRAPERPSAASSRSQLHLNTKKTMRPNKLSSYQVRQNSGMAIAAVADRGTDKGTDSDPVHQFRQLKLAWEEACPGGVEGVEAGTPDIRDMATRPAEVYYTLNMGMLVEEAAGNRKNRVPGVGTTCSPEGWRWDPPHYMQVESNLKDNRTFQGGAVVLIGVAMTIGHRAYSVGKHGLGM